MLDCRRSILVVGSMTRAEMTTFLHHEPCPECRKYGRDNRGNNLGVWDDHKYCFSCNYYEPIGLFERMTKAQFHSVESKEVVLPDDVTTNIRQDALAWIRQYSVTNQELEQNTVLWSPHKELLIFPIFDGTKSLLAWNGRYFGPNVEYPKYVTYGLRRNVFHHIHPDTPTNTVVLVEDMVSAIKVGRVASAMPLFSSDINKYRLFRVSGNFDNIVVWLDPNKHQHAIALSQRAESFFKKVGVVLSDKDPKCYTTQEIEEYVSDN